MIKVFLVEDEFVVREGIKRIIEWEENGFDFCGEASDGELAFPMIQKEKPDIVITDIRMPFMDGLALSRLIKEQLPQTEIIILSGHEEFDYAKEALRIGVSEYLLKPISSEKLLEAVSVLAVKIKEKRAEEELKAQYLKDQVESNKESRRELFRYLVTGEKPTSELLGLGSRLQIGLTAICYSVMILGVYAEDREANEYSRRIVSIEETLREWVDSHNAVFFDRKLEGYAILFKADEEDEILALQKEFSLVVAATIKQFEKIKYYGAVGKTVMRLGEIPDSFQTASKGYATRFFRTGSDILLSVSPELTGLPETDEDTIDIAKIDPKVFERSKIRDFLLHGEDAEIVYFVDGFVSNLGQSVLESKMFRQYIMMDLFFNVSEFVTESLGMEGKFSSEEVNIMSAIGSLEQTRDYICKILRIAIDLREQAVGNKHSDVVETVKKYIEEHFREEELSLNEIASMVNFSPNHLSMVFSSQVGEPLFKYVTGVRMEKAKELLRCTSKKSSEIAFEIGYKDPHYFSYLFKKTQGMTPTQYRDN